MNNKISLFAWALIGCITVAMAGNNDQGSTGGKSDRSNVHFYHHTAISVNGYRQPYEIVISKAITVPNPEKNMFVKYAQPTLQIVDGSPIWTITSDQFPITRNDCDREEIEPCLNGDAYYCYDACLANLPPNILAFDEKANKLYFMVGANDIGTGGGSGFVLAADLNKREVKLLSKAWFGEAASLSPTGRYLILYNFYAIMVSDIQTNISFRTNSLDNIVYPSEKQLYHSLKFQRWFTDTQFSYIDVARIRNLKNKFDPRPFINAKEIIYDIATKKVIHERMMTAEEVKAAGIKPSL